MEKLLYHYTNHVGLMGIMESKGIWASKIQYLNDFMEFNHAIEVSKTIIKEKREKRKDSVLDILFNKLTDKLEQIKNLNIFVASLSEEGDLLSQWRGYCPEGSGYSIGFSKKLIQKTILPQGFTLARCIYDQKKQNELMKKIINRAIQYTSPAKNKNADLEYILKIVDKAAFNFVADFEKTAPFIKHPSFREEREWRIASNVIFTSDVRHKMRIGKSALVPYVEVNLADDKNDVPIRHIVVGPGPTGDLSMDSVGTYLSNNNVKRWTVNQSSIPYRI
ncbi:DUF2971 domain-containing protein [Desulfobacula phenolica]|uniref:DUF2971 domain-containing protein n=1 Tax=Desulfobacula phenolica TaxID=90732 RepID=A0A1H2KH75_9BACT|nr:DUF2971 domain-containing protein [Desulfobacula phenolica]SDU67953.1 Protein of unknown function [Desulfobacula phenolica]